MNSGLGENHPKVKALRATKAVYVQQLDPKLQPGDKIEVPQSFF